MDGRLSHLDIISDNGDITRVGDSDRALLLGRSDGVLLMEDLLKLLQSPANSLNTDEIPDDRLDDIPPNEDEDVVVFDVGQRNGSCVGIDKRYLGMVEEKK